jgi:hypothetical protein
MEILDIITQVARDCQTVNFGIAPFQSSIALPALAVLGIGVIRVVKLAFSAC